MQKKETIKTLATSMLSGSWQRMEVLTMQQHLHTNGNKQKP